MIHIPHTLMAEIHAHAAEDYPREACGLLVWMFGDRLTYWPCTNQAEGNAQFELAPGDFAEAEDAGEVLAVVHTHPDATPQPSKTDRVQCTASGLPWLIVGWPRAELCWLQPFAQRPPNDASALPLLGRSFVYGAVDCYTLVRDWYWNFHRLLLHDYERSDEWWLTGGDLYRQYFAAEGFVPIPEPAPLRPGDALLMQIRAKVPNHAAIYLGDEMIMHHVMHRLSTRDPYGGFWHKCTALRLRHRSLA